jgi:hypothetical protein
MMDITVFSQNLRSKYKYFVPEFENLLNQNELTIILMQDMGNVGPDGPQELRQALQPHNLITNTIVTNKSRNTGIILHKNWEVIKVQKHDSGGLTGVEIKNGNTTLFVMCAYLPTALDAHGMPNSFDSTKEADAITKQEQAHAIYSTAAEWIQPHRNWILGGDLNETLESWDRKKLTEETYSYHGMETNSLRNFSLKFEEWISGELSIPTMESNPTRATHAFTIKGNPQQGLTSFLSLKSCSRVQTKLRCFSEAGTRMPQIT